MVAYSASLAPCDDNLDAGAGGIAALFPISAARAGHDEQADPSAVPRSYVESLTEPRDTVLGAVAFEPTDYCRVHYLIARADGDTYALPDDTGMNGISLLVEGRYTAPGGATGRFAIAESNAHGALVDLAEALDDPSALGGHAEVTIERSVDQLFDGIELDAVEDDQIGWAVLSNLAKTTRVTVFLQP